MGSSHDPQHTPLRAFACLEGNEPHLVAELACARPRAEVRDRAPGIVTVFDPDLDSRLAIAPPLELAFARAEFTLWAILEGSGGAASRELAARIGEALEDSGSPPRLHVWVQSERARDATVLEAKGLERSLRRALGGRIQSRIAADVEDEVVDVVLVEGRGIVLGAHSRTRRMSAYPGGQRRLEARPGAPSRAHLKLEEGLEWSDLPIREGDLALDVGCAPGGWSWVLLDRGLRVHGVDPAPVAPSVSGHTRFRHSRAPVGRLDRAALEPVRWIFWDMNGRARASLGQLEAVLARAPGATGLFYTLKLCGEAPAPALREATERLRAGGFDDVLARHLYHNRDELTLVARRGTARATPREMNP